MTVERTPSDKPPRGDDDAPNGASADQPDTNPQPPVAGEHPLIRTAEHVVSSWKTLFRVLVALVVLAALLYIPVALFDVDIHLGPLEITGR